MNVSIKAPAVIFCLVMAIPLLATPALASPPPKKTPGLEHSKVTNFAQAQALVSPATPALSTLETDGLGRNDSECNLGCVDH